MPSPKLAEAVINKAIEENRFGERLAYGFAIVFVLVGIGVLICGAIAGQGLIAVSGSIASVLFWPAMREARQLRRENLSIRLLQMPLSLAETEKEAAEAIRKAFTDIFGTSRENNSDV